MLRLLIIAVLIYGGYLVATFLKGEYNKAESRNGTPVETVPAGTPQTELPGMPPQLAASLETAEGRGPATLKKWLEVNRKNLRDPKLGDIELDYAVAVFRQDSAEARAIYKDVKERTPAHSPLQARLKRLEHTFE
jgi:hypothetical protein